MNAPHLLTLFPGRLGRRRELGLHHRRDLVQAGGFIDSGVLPPSLRDAKAAASILSDDLLTIQLDNIPVPVRGPGQRKGEDLVSRLGDLRQKKLVRFAEFEPLEIEISDRISNVQKVAHSRNRKLRVGLDHLVNPHLEKGGRSAIGKSHGTIDHSSFKYRYR